MFEGSPANEGKPEPIRVAPEVEAAIEKEPVSEKLKRKRLIWEMIKDWKERYPGEEIPDVEVVDTEEEAA